MNATTYDSSSAVTPPARAHDEELEAARIALSGTALERARLGAIALSKLLANPKDTHQVFLMGLLLNRGHYPEFLARLTLDDDGGRLLRERPTIDSRHVDLDALRALPDGTLGREYVRYLESHELDPDLFQEPPGLPDVPRYIGKRMRQVHDLWHVLTGYETDVPGEAALQAFTYAQTQMPSSGAIALAAAIFFNAKHPGIARKVVEGYRRGRRARFLAPMVLEDHWATPIDQLRRDLALA